MRRTSARADFLAPLPRELLRKRRGRGAKVGGPGGPRGSPEAGRGSGHGGWRRDGARDVTRGRGGGGPPQPPRAATGRGAPDIAAFGTPPLPDRGSARAVPSAAADAREPTDYLGCCAKFLAFGSLWPEDGVKCG